MSSRKNCKRYHEEQLKEEPHAETLERLVPHIKRMREARNKLMNKRIPGFNEEIENEEIKEEKKQ